MIESIISPAYLVGGSVRDELLGKTPKDHDYCTPLSPDEIELAVQNAGKRAFVTGKRFGTIGFKHDNQFIEVTTFRSEEYDNTRKPTVQFVKTIEQDLSRRDFTINAMAKRGNKTIDLFGGKEDLGNKIIRAVGNPTIRFKEDPLRMLRAVRFVAQLGFEIEPLTMSSIQKNAKSILRVSKERWVQELDRLLTSDNVASGLHALADSGLLRYVLPELYIQVGYDQNSDYHNLTLWEHTVSTVEATENNVTLRWAALLHDVGKPFVRTENKRGTSNYVFHELLGKEMVWKIGKYLRFGNDRLNELQEIVAHHLEDESPIRKADNQSKKEKKDIHSLSDNKETIQ